MAAERLLTIERFTLVQGDAGAGSASTGRLIARTGAIDCTGTRGGLTELAAGLHARLLP